MLKGGVVYVADGRWVGPSASQTRAWIAEAEQEISTAPQNVRRRFCTAIGSFDFQFYGDEVVGSYVILTRDRIGSFYGKKNEAGPETDRNRFAGRWMDGDGEGDLFVDFSSDYLTFETQYRSDQEPETWYTEWSGARRLGSGHEFDSGGTRYRCE